jgi:hypothetical protein
MARAVRQLKVFAASPNDVASHRESLKEIIDELNKGVASDKGISLEFVTWRDVSPDIGRPEQIILDQIGKFDIFIGIMARRFGTGTGKYEAGTEEEYYAAYNRFAATGGPRILFYFSQESGPPPRSAEELEQLTAVLRFRQSIQDQGLFKEFSNHKEFVDYARRDLTSVVINWDRPPEVDRATEPSFFTVRHWPIWRDASVAGRMPGHTVEAALFNNAKHSIEFMTISGRSVFNSSLESVIKSKPNGFVFRLFLFDWNSSYFDAKMRDERRHTKDEIEMARRKARDIAEQFLMLSRVSDARIEIKLYAEYPVWRLLIVDGGHAYVGHYPRDKRGYEGPMTLLESDNKTELFYPIHQYFATRWDAAGALLQYGDVRLRLHSESPGA